MLGGNWAKQMPGYFMTQRLCSIHFSYPVIHHLLAIVNEAIGNYDDVDTNGGKRFFFIKMSEFSKQANELGRM